MENTLDQVAESEDAIHLLLIARTKLGKSTYAAQAAIDGFHVIYIDSDNGLSALNYALKGKPLEVRQRVQYFSVKRPVMFQQVLLRSSTAKPGRWIPSLQREWGPSASGVTPDTEVWQFDATKIPGGVLMVIDSWTSTANDALGIGAPEQSAALLDGTDQSIYGDANVNCNYICNLIQKTKFHVMVLAHEAKYEVYRKPVNVKAGDLKQKDMTLEDTVDVPQSTSYKNGFNMVSRFNYIGWLNMNGLGEVEIDFTRKPNRVGGGPPNKIAKIQDLPFSKLANVLPIPPFDDWFRKTTHGDLVAADKTGLAALSIKK